MKSQKQTIIWLIVFLSTILFFSGELFAGDQPVKKDSISFKYGIIGKSKEKPDSLFEVADGSVLHSGDFFKINFKMASKADFYVIFQFSNGEYSLFHSASNLREENTAETISTSLDWLELDSNVGTETIYLISSKNPLFKLEDLFAKYQESKKRLKQKFVGKISKELLSVTQEKKEAPQLLQARLEKPENIGGTFRGALEEGEIEHCLFNQCSGKNIAFEIIKIIHQ